MELTMGEGDGVGEVGRRYSGSASTYADGKMWSAHGSMKQGPVTCRVSNTKLLLC